MPTASMQASGPRPPVISVSASRTFTSRKFNTSAPAAALRVPEFRRRNAESRN